LTENNTQEAQDLASKAGVQTKQAGRQAKAAARTGGKAVKAAAEPVVEAAAEEARDTANKLEGTAEDAVEAARKVNLGVLSRMSSDTGVGFLALSVAIYSGAVAYTKFRQAASGRSQVIS
jgi:ATP phosphoribosyltransferase regulatory subunit HisZ